jgi:uncharacterized membrane protein
MSNSTIISNSFIKVWIIKVHKAAASLSSSFWFIPTLLIGFAIITAQYLLPYLSANVVETEFLNDTGISSATTAMQLVQVVASSVITVTSIAFSMTLVALVMASNSFGPRLIRSFMENKKTQFVLGFLSASFVYCLIVLSQINLDGNTASYPILSVFVALILAIICVFVLIFFIHHVAVSIRADTVVEEISKSLLADMRRLQCNHDNRAIAEVGLCSVEQYTHKKIIRTKCIGYVQAIEYEKLAEITAKYDGLMYMNVRAGKYIYPDTEIAYIFSDQVISIDINIDESLITGTQRTPLQDPQFAINQLVEMALRALSPSMDDPFTALTCIDKLSAAMASFTEKNLPKTLILDITKTARVLTNEESFSDLFTGAFTQIRQSSTQQTAVLCHLLSTFYNLLEAKEFAEYLLDPIKNQVNAIRQSVEEERCLTNELDINAVKKRIANIIDAIKSQSD